ncbi:MAG: DNA polymerase III subunit gamma/tau [Candidatus Dasytiphilus stammeri]
MSYQVLASKWRPQVFADVVGQEHILTALTNSLKLGRLHHAYIFSGMRGLGKTSIARLFAKALNCETRIDANPCGKCLSCMEIRQGTFIDLIEIDAASRTRVEDIRELIDDIQYLPVRGYYKIYLIDEVHMLSRHSFNALLKSLEQPPPHVKFILATTDPQKIPLTIISRCMQFHLKILDINLIGKQLKKILKAEKIAFETSALSLISKVADGSMRDALTLTDQAIVYSNGHITLSSVNSMLGYLDSAQIGELIEAFAYTEGSKIMKVLNKIDTLRIIDWEFLLVEMLTMLHHIAMVQLLPEYVTKQQEYLNLTAPTVNIIQLLAKTLSLKDTQIYYDILLRGRADLFLAPNKKIGVEMTLLRALTLRFHYKEHPIISPNTDDLHNNLTKDNPIPYSDFNLNDLKDKKINPNLSCADDPINHLHSNQKILMCKKKILAPQQPKKTLLIPLLNKGLSEPPSNSDDKTVKLEIPLSKVLLPIPGLKDEISAQINEEVILQDSWSAEITKIALPKLVKEIALNSWCEQDKDIVVLHLRSRKRHLNNSSARIILTNVISRHREQLTKVYIVEDDNIHFKTPYELIKEIYKKKIQKTIKKLEQNGHIYMLCCTFDAKIDAKSLVLDS